MALKFQPRTEEEIQRSRMLPKGAYPFTVASSAEQASKSEKNKGRMMVALKLLVHSDDGDVFQNDYFADWFSGHKLRHFAESVGKLADYEKGVLDFANNSYQGATGYLFLGERVRKDTGDLQNEVKDYLTEADFMRETKKSTPATAAPTAEQSAPEDDDVPF